MGGAEPLSILERAGLARARDALVGASISVARYWVLPPAPRLAELDAGRVHEVDSVELESDTGRVVRIRWATVGFDEGLAVEVDPDPLGASGLAVIDVGEAPPWAEMLGQRVTQMRVAWQVSSDNGSQLLWAVSFRTASGGHVSIALGEVQDGTPTYLPDSLVVLFSSATAAAYQPPASETSAWGEVIDPDLS